MSREKIPFIIDESTGKKLCPDKFLAQPEEVIFEMRRKLKEKQEKFLCGMCNQPLNLKGKKGGKVVMHFAHFQESGDCPCKENRYTKDEINAMVYNGVKEGKLHKAIKNFIAEQLKIDDRFTNVKVEKYLYGSGLSKEWKIPDVYANFCNYSIAFEIQLATTFLDVIIRKENFYKDQKTFTMWFLFGDPDKKLLRFAEKDIFYSNKNQVFILNNEMISKSKKKKGLYFICYHKKAMLRGKTIIHQNVQEVISFDNLKFDIKNYKPYYYDTKVEEKNLRSKLKYCSSWYKNWETAFTKRRIKKLQDGCFQRKNKKLYLADTKLDTYTNTVASSILLNINQENIYLSNYHSNRCKSIENKYYQSLSNLEERIGIDDILESISGNKTEILALKNEKIKLEEKVSLYKKEKENAKEIAISDFDKIVEGDFWKLSIKIENPRDIAENYKLYKKSVKKREKFENNIFRINSFGTENVSGDILWSIPYNLALKLIEEKTIWVIPKSGLRSCYPVYYYYPLSNLSKEKNYFFADFEEDILGWRDIVNNTNNDINLYTKKIEEDKKYLEKTCVELLETKIADVKQQYASLTTEIESINKKVNLLNAKVKQLELEKKEKKLQLDHWKQSELKKLESSKNIYTWKSNRENLTTWLIDDSLTIYVEKDNLIYKKVNQDGENIFFQKISVTDLIKSVFGAL